MHPLTIAIYHKVFLCKDRGINMFLKKSEVA